MRLLIVADDLTGAMDTGIKFADRGITVQVFPSAVFEEENLREETEAVVVNTKSRHLPVNEAYRAVYGVVKKALAAGCTAVYKKTDSGLRGLTGAEIAAACDACGCGAVFAPALPAVGRVTVGGIHYCDGVPVAESAFGTDPIDPVKHSAVEEIIAETAPEGTKTRVASGPGAFMPEGREIVICDAQTDEELGEIADVVLGEAGDVLPVLCGCAGFADALADRLPFEKHPHGPSAGAAKTLFLAGSLHPVTEQQIRTARTAGVACWHVNAADLLDPEGFGKGSGRAARAFEKTMAALQAEGRAIFAVERENAMDDASAAAWAAGIPAEEVPERITATFAEAARRALQTDASTRLFLTGGDTLQAVLEALGVTEITPLAELRRGIVEMELNTKDFGSVRAVSKAGGLGTSADVAEILTE